MVALDGLADRVDVARAPEREVRCRGVEGAANLAWRALDELEREVGRSLPVAVTIEKAIPSEGGLGGGSSDAAATLVATDRLHELGLDAPALERVAARVGSDVPFFVRGGAQWGEGRGDRLRPGRCPAFAALVVRPGIGLATADVYRAFDRLGRDGHGWPPPGARSGSGNDGPGHLGELARWVGNDLWPAALALEPSLGRAARSLAAVGARPVLMSGSGSCLAGVFTDADAARAAAARLPPGSGVVGVVTPSARGVRLRADG